MAARTGMNGVDREPLKSRSPTPSDASSTKANVSISINSPDIRIDNDKLPVTITVDNIPIRITSGGKLEGLPGQPIERPPRPELSNINMPPQDNANAGIRAPLVAPVPRPTPRKEVWPSPQYQHGYIPFCCVHSPNCPNCWCLPLSKASEAAAQHEREQEMKRAEQERLKEEEEARLGREALEILRQEQELLRQRASIRHERRLYEENRKRWLMRLQAL